MRSTKWSKFFAIIGLLITLSLSTSCGSDSNRVESSDVNNGGNTPAPAPVPNPGGVPNYISTAEGTINSLMSSYQCPNGGARVNFYFQSQGQMSSSQTQISNFQPTGNAAPGSITKIFVGKTTEVTNDFIVVRELGDGAQTMNYHITLALCSNSIINQTTQIQGLQGGLVLDTQVNCSLGFVDSTKNYGRTGSSPLTLYFNTPNTLGFNQIPLSYSKPDPFRQVLQCDTF